MTISFCRFVKSILINCKHYHPFWITFEKFYLLFIAETRFYSIKLQIASNTGHLVFYIKCTLLSLENGRVNLSWLINIVKLSYSPCIKFIEVSNTDLCKGAMYGTIWLLDWGLVCPKFFDWRTKKSRLMQIMLTQR